MQAAVKEVPDSGHDQKLRLRIQPIHPADDALRVDHLIRIASLLPTPLKLKRRAGIPASRRA